MESELVMYIFVNSDLKLRKGRAAAQVGHIVQTITEEIIRDNYERFPPPLYCLTYIKWSQKCTKVVLQATELELNELLKHSEARSFIDTDTEGKKILTTVGFFPSTNHNFDSYKLL
ncbi:Hypothetical protein HVR_LOCUS189 [uncultured virus]|nr:Hypothetical protein HVR_LOCUS189 [uncultured virus]